MPSKSAKSSKAQMGAMQQQTHHAEVVGWAKKLWGAIKDRSYALASRAPGSRCWTMLPQFTITSHRRGYQPNVHYQPLKDAVFNFCSNKPVAEWIGPPDQWSRSPSPTLDSLKGMPTPMKKVSKAALTKTIPPPLRLKPQDCVACMVAGPSKKGKLKAPISEELVGLSDDKHFGEEQEEPKALQQARGSRPLPSTVGMDENIPKCTMCTQRGHICHHNPKATNLLTACFECNHWKLKCLLAAPQVKKQGEPAADTSACGKRQADPAPDTPTLGKKQAEPAHNDDEVEMEIDIPPAKQRMSRRKPPTQIPPGQPGQYGAMSFPPDILKKLEDYESATSKQNEKIEQLSQTVARLTQENRTTWEWFDTHLKLLWETTNTRDENIGAAMRAIFEQVEETSRHVALRETREKLNALLKVVRLPHKDSIAKPSTPTPAFQTPASPTPASLIPRPTTPKLLPPLELSSPRADSTRIPMFPQDADIIEVDESPKSNKRSGSIVTPGESKRHKVGVS
ncbi:hypothetical protein BYT27DRAFT_7217923 [Phlegmacium glaucopus]|nr:hypothetical protein BYT27DRAFT_7217923 [Phlegmacium glaucopus]